MTGFESVSLAVAVVGVLVALVAVPAFVLMWIQATDEQRERFRKFWKKIGARAYRGWAYVSCLILVASGVERVTAFVTSSAPITRLDIFLLLLNLMSLMVFSVASLIMFVGFRLTDLKQKALLQNKPT